MGMDSLAITDHGGLYGAIEFYQECLKNNIKPIIEKFSFDEINKAITRLISGQVHYRIVLQKIGEEYEIQAKRNDHIESYCGEYSLEIPKNHNIVSMRLNISESALFK